MQLTGYKKFVLALLLLAFTGQSLASVTMMCELDNSLAITSIDTHMNSMDHDMSSMDHDMSAMHHDMNPMTNTDHAAHTKTDSLFNCCKIAGHCLLAGCALLVTNQSLIIIFSKSTSAAEDLYSSLVPSPLATSLYRPPIFI